MFRSCVCEKTHGCKGKTYCAASKKIKPQGSPNILQNKIYLTRKHASQSQYFQQHFNHAQSKNDSGKNHKEDDPQKTACALTSANLNSNPNFNLTCNSQTFSNIANFQHQQHHKMMHPEVISDACQFNAKLFQYHYLPTSATSQDDAPREHLRYMSSLHATAQVDAPDTKDNAPDTKDRVYGSRPPHIHRRTNRRMVSCHR